VQAMLTINNRSHHESAHTRVSLRMYITDQSEFGQVTAKRFIHRSLKLVLQASLPKGSMPLVLFYLFFLFLGVIWVFLGLCRKGHVHVVLLCAVGATCMWRCSMLLGPRACDAALCCWGHVHVALLHVGGATCM
jgi:hypothetical protein